MKPRMRLALKDDHLAMRGQPIACGRTRNPCANYDEINLSSDTFYHLFTQNIAAALDNAS
jgi:hypothetical protein